MGLYQTGELLAATTEHGKRRADNEPFTIEKLHLFDREAGKAVEVSIGRAFDRQAWMDLNKEADNRPRISVRCTVSAKGGLYAEELVDFAVPVPSK